MSKQTGTKRKRGTVAAVAPAGHRGAGIVAELRAEIAKAERAGQTRYAIARKAGITPIMLARIADGERGMKLETAAKIADAVDLRLTLLPKRVLSS